MSDGMSWTSVPPLATLRTWMPRQIAKIGRCDVVAAGQEQTVDAFERLLDGHRRVDQSHLSSDVEDGLLVILDFPAGADRDERHGYIRVGTSIPIKSSARVS